MKNKGLIKKLKGVGFVPLKGVNTTTLVKIIEGDEFNYNYTSSNFWKTESSNSCNIFDVTFPQILAAIKEHTGVDLTPKKTKREEIEELKECIAEIGEEKHRTWERLSKLEGEIQKISLSHQSDSDKHRVEIKSMQDAIKSQDEAIEGLKNCIAPHKYKYFFGVDYGTSSDCVDALRLAVKSTGIKDGKEFFEFVKVPAPDMSDLKDVSARVEETFKGYEKQAAEMQAEEKKGFEVGDPVVIACKKRLGFSGDLCRAIENKSIIKVANVNNKDKCVCVILNHREYYFGFDELEHAPEEPKVKALEFGDPVQSMVSFDGLKAGEKLVFLSKTKKGYCNVIDKHSNHYILDSCDFKPL